MPTAFFKMARPLLKSIATRVSDIVDDEDKGKGYYLTDEGDGGVLTSCYNELAGEPEGRGHWSCRQLHPPLWAARTEMA